MSKRKDRRRADALRAATERVKQCKLRLEMAKLGGKQSEIDSKTHKLSVAIAQESQLRHKIKRKAKRD